MGRRKLVRILMEMNTVDVSIKNQQHETPLDIATRKRFPEIAETIRNPPKCPSNDQDQDGDGDEGDHREREKHLDIEINSVAGKGKKTKKVIQQYFIGIQKDIELLY